VRESADDDELAEQWQRTFAYLDQYSPEDLAVERPPAATIHQVLRVLQYR
jgi:hypothetical protein